MSEAVQTLAPKRLSAEQAVWRSSLLGVHRTLAFTWDGEPATLSFGDREIEQPGGVAVQLRLGDSMFAVRLHDWVELAPARRLLGEAQFNLLPSDLQLAIAEATFGELLEAAAASLGVECSVVGVGPQITEDAASVPFTLNVEGRNWTGSVTADDSSWKSLATWFEAADAANVRDAASLPVAVKLRFDPIPMTTEEAESLEPGDVLSLQQVDSPLSGCLLVGSQCSHEAVINDDSLTVASSEAGVTDEPHLFLIAETSGPAMTIGTAESLDGEVPFRLEEKAWTLRWNDRHAGVGSLVRQGGRSYLRILEWSPTPRLANTIG